MKIRTQIIVLAALGVTLASHVSAQALHEWTFSEPAGTVFGPNLVNSGTGATSGGPTWGALAASDGTTNWATTGSDTLRIAGNNSNTGTLVTSVVTMPELNTGTIRFEWDVSWTLTEMPGVIQETYLINRDEGGGNRFRWTLQNPSGSGDPLFRLNLDGQGFAAINNVSATQNDVTLNGTGGNLVLRTDVTFGDVNGSNGVTGLAAFYNYNGSGFTGITISSFTPYAVANLNDLRLHSKGALSGTNYLDFNNISVYAIPEPSTYAAIFGLFVIGLAWVRRRRS
jgi:hypothetical protein